MPLSVFGHSSDSFCPTPGAVRTTYTESAIDPSGGGGVGGVCGVRSSGCGGCECSGRNEGHLTLGRVWWALVGQRSGGQSCCVLSVF